MSVKLTAALLQKRAEADAKRRELESQARPYAAEVRRIDAELIAALDAAGKTNAKRGSFRVAIVEKPGRVKWRDEFITIAGPATAQELIDKAKPSRSVSVSSV